MYELPNSLFFRNWAVVSLIIHGVSNHENPLAQHSLAHQIAFHVLSIDHDGIGVAVDIAGERPGQAMERSLQPHPDAGPQDAWFTPEPGNEIGDGQGKAAGDTFDVDIIIPPPQFPGQSRRDSRPAQAKAGQILIMKIAGLHAVLLLPVPFVTSGEEVVIDVVIAA